jgi:molybdopterin/thiamine biosynthesis adenylyltransferase
MATRYARQLDIVDEEKLKFPIHIIGCGGIGSWTALLLAKMGCSNITVYDNDDVENHNVASQFFKEEDLGKNKCLATQINVSMFSGYNVNIKDQEEEEDIKSGVVIFAVDSAEERIRLGKIFEDRDIFIIDGRMGGLQAEVYCRRSNNYLPTTVAPENVETDACTARSIAFNCAFIGSMIANYVRLFATGKLDPLSETNEFIFLFDNLAMLKKK